VSSAAAQERYPYPNETPEGIEGQRRALHNLGRLLLDASADVDDDVLLTTDSWRSDTATTAVSDVAALASGMKGDSDAIGGATGAMTTYVGNLEEARAAIDGIRGRYNEALEAKRYADAHPPEWAQGPLRHEYTSGNQQELTNAGTALDTEYDGVLADLEQQGRPAVAALHAALDVLAPPAQRGVGSLAEVAYGAASESLDLTGNHLELALREAGLLTGATPEGLYSQWLENAERQGVDSGTILQIASEHGITPESFELLAGMEEITDPQGKSFFVLPDDISAEDARQAVVLTYILNAGTDYGDTADVNDFEETPYSAAEVQRIIDRQESNSWSYDQDVGFVHGNGGRMVTTPNGVLMGLGGNWLQDLYSQQGGTMYGDIFMLNIDDAEDPVAALREVVESGRATYENDEGELYQGDLDLDRLLHHEERHSQQWAEEGYAGFLASYAWELITGGNETEEGAGLSDGGYH
jgi:hypothetical protein